MRYVLMTMVAALPGVHGAQAQPRLAMAPTTPRYGTAHPNWPTSLPTDPLQRDAYRAVVLREWPNTPQWKLDAYRIVLDRNIKAQGLARRTTYCPSCSGTTCADGSGVRDGVCAASPNIQMHAIVWLASDGLVKVCDRGGAVQVEGGCQSRGETANFDVWCPRCEGGCWTGPGTLARVPYAVVAIW
jgi:hypothetical protein